MKRSSNAVFLVSYAGVEDDYSMAVMSQPRRIYALVRVSFVSNVFKVESATAVPYQSVSPAPYCLLSLL